MLAVWNLSAVVIVTPEHVYPDLELKLRIYLVGFKFCLARLPVQVKHCEIAVSPNPGEILSPLMDLRSLPIQPEMTHYSTMLITF